MAAAGCHARSTKTPCEPPKVVRSPEQLRDFIDMEVVMARYLLFGHLTIDDTVLPDGRTAMGTVGGNVLYAAIGAHVWTDDLAIVARPGQGYPPSLIDELVASRYSWSRRLPHRPSTFRVPGAAGAVG